MTECHPNPPEVPEQTLTPEEVRKLVEASELQTNTAALFQSVSAAAKDHAVMLPPALARDLSTILRKLVTSTLEQTFVEPADAPGGRQGTAATEAVR